MEQKSNKIYVVEAVDDDLRQRALARLAVEHGFARIPSDAIKIISSSMDDIDLRTAYFVLANHYNFRGAVTTNQRLYELAARGLFVAVGVKKLPREYEFLCEVYHAEDYL